MVGVIGVNRRIFTTLANKGISVFMVSQASSENSTSIGVRDEDAEAAAEVLNEEFAKEIETGAAAGAWTRYADAFFAGHGLCCRRISEDEKVQFENM